MHRYSVTQMKKTLLIGGACAVALALMVFGMVCAFMMKPQIYDKKAQSGAPQGLSEHIGYVSYESDGVCKVTLACKPDFDGSIAKVYLTSPEENRVLVKAEFYSAQLVTQSDGSSDFLPDEKLGETGFLRPGTFVEDVKLKGLTAGSENRVFVKIATMNEADGTSNGVFYIRTVIS